MPDRLEIGDKALKLSRGHWVTGTPRVRRINGDMYEELLQIRHLTDAEQGVHCLMAQEGPSELQDALKDWAVHRATGILLKPGAALLALRGGIGYGQSRLAEDAGVAVSALREIEHGRSDPRASTLFRLLTTLRGAR